MENEVIIESWSPTANIQAFVEKSDKNYYFYFWINPVGPDSEIRSCWICNRVKAPADIDEAFAVEGEAPCMPAEFVNHDINGIELDEDSLSIKWFEEGDAAALLSGDKILAVIPYFSGYNGFHGYSIYADGMGPFAWELKEAYSKFEEQLNLNTPKTKSASTGNPFAREEDTLDSYTWLEDVNHSMNGPWHVYDVSFFAPAYDWEYIKNSAEYMVNTDLTKIVEVKIADTAEYNITNEFIQYGSLLMAPSMDKERRVISVAGFSKVLNMNMMIIWFANARGAKFITEFEDETLIRKYAETMLRQNFGTENEMKMGRAISL